MKSKWQSYIALLTIIALSIYLVLYFAAPSISAIPLLAIILIGGIPLCLQIIYDLLMGDVGADLLAALALITGVILHQYLAATLIILMLSGGQTLESYAKRKASSVLLALVARMPTIAHRKIDGQIEDIPLAEIKINDFIVVYPHDTCPIDGIVSEGQGSMDESFLTGEPYHMAKVPGAFVISGAINGEALLVIQATKIPADSRFAAIVKVLEAAEQKRPQIRRLGDQLGAIFAPIALAFALLAWYLSGEAVRFLCVLVIATPCPLLIAIPITIISAISRAAKQAIIIKDPTVLEQLPICRTAIFDKTGTLTYGQPTLTEIITVNDHKKEQILQYVASLERYSKHPLASAVLKVAKQQKIKLLEASQVSEIPGQGLRGTIHNHAIVITSRKILLETSPSCSSLLPELAPGLECIVMLDGKFAASLHFRDAPRNESQSFISHLMPAHHFNKIMVVSGDRESEVKYLADLLNLTEIHAAVSPEQKLAIVREEREKSPTVFMGDGINDAPALTAATVGIAFGQYSNVTAEAAGAIIMETSFSRVDELIHLSLETRKIILQSAIGGMTLSIIGMFFAAAGFINPVTGALLQEIIDVLAIANALRLAFGTEIKVDLPSTPEECN